MTTLEIPTDPKVTRIELPDRWVAVSVRTLEQLAQDPDSGMPLWRRLPALAMARGTYGHHPPFGPGELRRLLHVRRTDGTAGPPASARPH